MYMWKESEKIKVTEVNTIPASTQANFHTI